MDSEFYVQHGLCKTCKRETLVLSREKDRNNNSLDSVESENMCPYGGQTGDAFKVAEGFGEYSYNLDEDTFISLSELLGLRNCDKCDSPFLSAGDNRIVIELTFYMGSGSVRGYSCEHIHLCRNCYENSPQKDLVELCSHILTAKRPSFSIEGIESDRSVKAVEEAFKNRKIIYP